MAALRERAVNLLEEATCLIGEHASQGPKDGFLRNGAFNGRETNGRILEIFLKFISAVHGSRKPVNQFFKLQQSASAASAPAT